MIPNKIQQTMLLLLISLFLVSTPYTTMLTDKPNYFESDWHKNPKIQRTWIGPEFWANRLQDWQLRSGRLECKTNENHLVRELNLVRNIASGKGVPDSCTLLAIVGPKASFFPAELDTIKSYLDQGGKALIMLDPERPSDLAATLILPNCFYWF